MFSDPCEPDRLELRPKDEFARPVLSLSELDSRAISGDIVAISRNMLSFSLRFQLLDLTHLFLVATSLFGFSSKTDVRSYLRGGP